MNHHMSNIQQGANLFRTKKKRRKKKVLLLGKTRVLDTGLLFNINVQILSKWAKAPDDAHRL